MSVYVDAAIWPYRAGKRRMVMCHMIADTLDELHAMAERLGLKPQWFQAHSSFPHYDICKSKRAMAVKFKAVECDRAAFVQKMREIRGRMLAGSTPVSSRAAKRLRVD